MRRARARAVAVAAALLAGIAMPPNARAQAWVPDPGDATIAVSAQYARVMKHLFSVDVAGIVDPATGYLLGPGNRGYFGDISTMISTLSGEYVPLTRLAIAGELNYAASRYSGLSPESPYDDGQFHGDLQDLALGARYMFRRSSLVVTPSIDVRVPLTDYNALGHVGTGSGLRSVSLGLNTGRSLDPFAPLAYVFANYDRVIVQDVDTYSLDRNEWHAGLGTFVTRNLSLQGHFSYVDTVDGIDWWWSDPNHLHHEAVTAKALYRRIGAAAGYTVSRHASLALSWESTISGANVHAIQSLTLGASWGFWRKHPA